MVIWDWGGTSMNLSGMEKGKLSLGRLIVCHVLLSSYIPLCFLLLHPALHHVFFIDHCFVESKQVCSLNWFAMTGPGKILFDRGWHKKQRTRGYIRNIWHKALIFDSASQQISSSLWIWSIWMSARYFPQLLIIHVCEKLFCLSYSPIILLLFLTGLQQQCSPANTAVHGWLIDWLTE